MNKNKIDFKLFFKLFLFSIFVSFILYFFNYILFPTNSVFYNNNGSSYCLDISKFESVIFNFEFDYIYPQSCDQERYYSAFFNPSKLITTQHPYQTRPIYVIFIYVINLILSSLIGNNGIFSLQISTLIGHISIISIGTVLILSTFSKLSELKMTKKLFFQFMVLISPLIKYSIFDPSHQTLTYLNIALMMYILKNYELVNFSKFSIMTGVLFLTHRPFLLVFIVYFLYQNKLKFNFKNLILGIKGLSYVIFPYLIYRLTILFLGYEVYDGLIKKWGEFIWILDFIRGKVRFASDWHCVTIPENFECYFQDTFNAIIYLIIPTLSVLAMFISKKYFSYIEVNIIKSCLYYFLFWSFIGWYPPLRFNLYSLNYLVVLLLIVGFFQVENKLEKYLLLTSNVLFFASSTHWNNPEILNFNLFLKLSLTVFGIFIVFKFFKIFNKISEKVV